MSGVKGRSGRQKKPIEIHKLMGTFRKDRHGKSTPIPKIPKRNQISDPSIKKPKYITGEAKKEWDRLSPKLSKCGLLTHWDMSLFIAYCQTWSEFLMLSKNLKKLDDYTTVTANGTNIQNPLVGARNQCFKRLMQLCLEFGLSPSARARLGVSDVDEDVDPLQEILEMTG